MKRISLIALGCCIFLGGVFTVSSCVKKDFDTPPDESTYDPNLTVTNTIAELTAMPQGTAIDSNITISGIVVMDDKSGNYYKSIVLEDSTGGIQLLLDQNSLYNDYPVGRKIYVNCKGLYLGSYGGTPQLGYTPDNTGALSNIPYNLIADHVVKANYPNTVKVDTFTLDELASPNANISKLNTLIAIKNAEFADIDLGTSYAQAASLASATNHTIQDCLGGTITLRTSGYAKFQPAIIPNGNGVIVGIYTRYNNTPQLYIRDTTDVQFVNDRCDGSNPSQQYILNDPFASLTNWTAQSVTGAQVWSLAQYGNPKPCATMSGYSGGNHENEDWLISKPLDFTGFNTIKLSFESAAKYGGNVLECYISTDYTSGAPSTATWTQLTGATFADVNGNFTFVGSGSIDLSAYKNNTNVRIAFKYTSTNSDAASWELDNVKVVGEQ